MAQGQSGNTAVADAPDTLPPDFFDKKNGSAAPDTLPADFFEKKATANAPKSGSLDEYLSTPHTGSANETNELQAKVQKENLTPRMRAAIASGAATMQPPTQFEKDRPGEGISLKGTGSAIWDKLKSMVPSDPTGGHSPFEKEFWIGEGPKFDLANSGIAQMGREAQNEYQRSRSAGSNPLAAAGSATVAAAASPFGVSNIEQQKMAERGEGGAIIGDTIPAVAAAALPLGLEAVGKIPPIRAMRSGVGNLLVDEMGKPKAIPRLVLGNDRAAALGELAKPEIAERQGAQEIRAAKAEMDQDIASGQQSRAAARQEMFNDLANSRVNRGEEQAKLDTGFEKKLREQETARQKELAANERLKTMQGNDLMRRGTEQEALDKEAGTIPRIVSPTEGEPVRTGSEGRPATWRGERVEALAKRGIRPAITQQIVRGEELPENVRYVMGDPDFPRAVYNPREVTRFTPEGEPIRNKANPFTEGQPSTIPTIARTPRGSIPNIGESPSKGATLPFPGPLPETSTPLAAAPPVEPVAAPTPPAAMNIKPLENVKPILPEPEPQEVKIKGITAEEPKHKAAAKPKAVPADKRFSQQDILDAEGLLASEAGASLAGERPGRYYDEANPGDVRLRSRGAQTKGGDWRGVKSGRNMFPFLRENPDVNPSAIEKALRNKDSAAYSRLIEKAVEFNRRSNPNPEDYAYNFIKAMGENPDAEPVEEPTTAQPEAQTAGTIPKIGETGIIPGMEKDVAAQKQGAAKVAGENLTAEANKPKDISEAAGRMETRSPLFRGTEASPQKEIFGNTPFKVPTTKQLVPPPIEQALQDTSWQYEGKNDLGLYTIKEPGTNIRVSLFERDLNPDFIRRKIAEKEKQFGTPTKGKGKPKETGGEEVPF